MEPEQQSPGTNGTDVSALQHTEGTAATPAPEQASHDAVAAGAHTSKNIVIILVLAIIVVVLALMYLWGAGLTTPPPPPPAPPAEVPVAPTAAAPDPQVQALTDVSTSTDTASIEADLNATSMDSLDAGLDQMDTELNTALQQ